MKVDWPLILSTLAFCMSLGMMFFLGCQHSQKPIPVPVIQEWWVCVPNTLVREHAPDSNTYDSFGVMV